MTKNELLRRIAELGYTHTYDELRDKLRISTISEPSSYYISIGNYDFKVHDGYVVSSERSKKLVRYILDYLDTPIEEREEEKKYMLLSPKSFSELQSALVYSDVFQGFVLGIKEMDSKSIKKEFTQKEIDEMPFDTNFFVKEEVK